MKILDTRRIVAMIVTLAMLAIDSCSPSVNAGLKPNTASRTQGSAQLQMLATQTGQEKPESTISIETALVNLNVLVTDEEGRVLSGLTPYEEVQ